MMFNEMKRVYSLMEDDQSRNIFLNRILYNITKDYTYIDNIVSVYFERMQKEFHWGTQMQKQSKTADR